MKVVRTYSIEKEVADWIEGEAKASNRTRSNLVETVIRRAMGH